MVLNAPFEVLSETKICYRIYWKAFGLLSGSRTPNTLTLCQATGVQVPVGFIYVQYAPK